MIDLILNFDNKNIDDEKLTSFQNEIINTGNARYIFLFAKYIKNADIEKLTYAILKTNNKRYIHFFIRSIENVNYELFVQKVLEFKDADLLYYIIYDTLNLPEKFIITIAKGIYQLKNYRRLKELCYYYFNILKLSNIEMFNLLKELLENENIDIKNITATNCYLILEKLKQQLSQSDKFESKNNYSKNYFIGRKNLIPDLIVCHITSNYKKAINTFYDEDSKVSSHFIVSEKGELKQIIDLKNTAWANGTSLNQDSDVYYKFSTNELISQRSENANYYSFSIEHESLDGYLTDLQYEKTLEIMKEIIIFVKENYNQNFIIDRNHIVGHNEINPIVRTVCPGHKFPFTKLIDDLKKWSLHST